MIWQVTLLDGGTSDNSTQYPIASKSESQFEDGRPAHSRPERETPGNVKKTQPYHRGDRASAHALSVLASLSNTDKHRVLNSTYSFLETDSTEALDSLGRNRPNEPTSVIGFWMAKTGTRMDHGTPWFIINWDRSEEPPRNVQVGGNLRTGIVFGDIGLDASDFRNIAQDVLKIIHAFMADFPETVFVDE
jgi:hypothetical protein